MYPSARVAPLAQAAPLSAVAAFPSFSERHDIGSAPALKRRRRDDLEPGRRRACFGRDGRSRRRGAIGPLFVELAKPLTRPDLEGKRSAPVSGGLSVRL
jgi:hypothetical protein